MIDLYNKETVKSGVFLFPLIGTSRYSEFPHRRTYLVCEDMGIDEQSKKLIVTYTKLEDVRYAEYDSKMLSGNRYFLDFLETGDTFYYVFDLKEINKDWDLFLGGKYSKLSNEVKKRIMAYHAIVDKGVKKDNRTMQEILYPYNPTMTEREGRVVEFKDAFERHAPSLRIDPALMREVGEIYSRPDFRKETLVLTKVS